MSRVTLSFCISVALLLTVSCAQSQKAPPQPGDQTVVASTPPFLTKEPERYRATRTITTITATGETIVTRNLITRAGEQRRDEVDSYSSRVIYLELKEGSFVLLPDQKQFAELGETDPETNTDEDAENLADLLLHTDPKTSTYQLVGPETVNGRNAQKYRVVVNTPPDANVSTGETLIWIDDALQMPIKWEMKSVNGAHSVMELSEIALDVDQSLFLMPKDYEKISFSDLLRRLKLK